MTLRVEGLWRYPVKSLAGEALEAAELTEDGIPGDRIVHVRGTEGVRTSRRHYRLLDLRGTLDPNGDFWSTVIPGAAQTRWQPSGQQLEMTCGLRRTRGWNA